MVQEKLKNTRQNMTPNGDISTPDNLNTSIDPTSNTVPNSTSSIRALQEKRKGNQASSSHLLKKKKNI